MFVMKWNSYFELIVQIDTKLAKAGIFDSSLNQSLKQLTDLNE